MPINSDAFGPPRSIGQGLTGILSPGYDVPSGGKGDEGEGAQQAAAGPFGAGGALSQQADQTREGLAALLRGASSGGGGSAEPTLGGETSAIPVSNLGLPKLGGSTVSTAGTAATTSPSPSSATANTQGGLAALLNASDSGSSTSGSAPGSDPSAAGTPDPGIPSSVSRGLTAGRIGMTGLSMLTSSAIPAMLGSVFGAFNTPFAVAEAGRMASNFFTGGTQKTINNFNAALNAMSPEEASSTIAAMASEFSTAAASINAGQATVVSNPTVAAMLSNAGYAAFNSPQGPIFSMSAVGQGTLGFSPPNTATAPRGVDDAPPSAPPAPPDAPPDEGVPGDPSGGPAGGPAGGAAGAGTAGEGSGASGPGGDAAWHRGGLVADRGKPGGEERGRLLPGEFVLQPPAVKKYGLARLTALNEGRA